MASSDHLTASLIDPWILRPGASFLDPWFTDAFSADSSSSDTSLVPGVVSSFLIPTPGLNNAYLSSGSDSFEIENVLLGEEAVRCAYAPSPLQKQKQRNGGVASGKVVKRKSRSTKRSETTFIMADPASFRQMVQQVTGSRLGHNHAINNGQIMQPEPHRRGSDLSSNNGSRSSSLASIAECLPTLDTSALLLDRHRAQDKQHAVEMMGEGSVDPVGGFSEDLEQFGSFPTLDSWESM